MANHGKCLAIIPARGGSKGIPYKNRRQFLGKPLIEWTISSALRSGSCDRIIVSTDDSKIANIAKTNGAEVPFIRPEMLARDETPSVDVVTHVVEKLVETENYQADCILVLEPTSPGRQPDHINMALELLSKPKVDSVASVTKVPHHYHPAKQLLLENENELRGIDGLHPNDMIHRRQDLTHYYSFDGLIFACKTQLLTLLRPTLWGPRVRGLIVESIYSVDLDELEDWVPAEEKLRPLLCQ